MQVIQTKQTTSFVEPCRRPFWNEDVIFLSFVSKNEIVFWSNTTMVKVWWDLGTKKRLAQETVVVAIKRNQRWLFVGNMNQPVVSHVTVPRLLFQTDAQTKEQTN